MARKPRIDFPGAWHHVMNRGARREPTFLADEHASWMISSLRSMSERYEIEVHGYSLMPNHYHALVRSRQGNLSRSMQHMGAHFSQGVNAMHQWDGPIFKGRFKSELIEDETTLSFVLAYIHLNPLRARLIPRLNSKNSWTSHRAYLGKDVNDNAWLNTSYFLDLFGDGSALHEYIMKLHRGGIAWPEHMSLETGFFNQVEETAEKHDQQSFNTRFLTPEEVLHHVCRITGSSIRKIRKSVYGPRANPARRFAVYALRQRTLCTLVEIGTQIDMTPVQVSNTLTRIQPGNEPIKAWSNLLDEILDK